MSKLLQKTSAVALDEIRDALAELRNCQAEIQKGLTAQVYDDRANEKVKKAIHHMLNAEDWIDALNKECADEIQ